MALENRPLVLVADHQPEITKLVAVSLEHEGLRVGRKIRMSPNEWLLLELFLTNESRILIHAEIVTRVLGPQYRDDIAYLRLWVGQLRRKLGIPAWDGGAIRTVQGLGYAYDPKDTLPRMQSRRPCQPVAV